MSEPVTRKAGDHIRFGGPSGKVYEGMITSVVESEGEAYYHMNAMIGDERVEDGLIFEDEVVKDDRQVTLWQIAQEVAKGETIASDDMGGNFCVHCNGDPDYADLSNFHHESSCIVMKARALMKWRKKGSEGKQRMSIRTAINPFAPFVKEHLTPLQGEIEAWLQSLDKTLDDVVWWEVNATNVSPSPFIDDPKWKYGITIALAGSEEKHTKTFLMGMRKKYLE